jgi:hypothetical protein
MPKKPPRYDLAVQRRAVEQVLQHHRPVAQVARQLRCSPQSIKNWIDKHHKPSATPSIVPMSSASTSSLTFLPIQIEPSPLSPTGNIELVTKNGLTLRFPVETSSEALCDIIRQLESVPC